MPFVVAFEPYWEFYALSQSYRYLTNLFFTFDVIIHFNTSVYDKEGNEHLERKYLARNYIKSFYFWIDTIAAIPIPTSNLFLKQLVIVKVIRLSSMKKIIEQMDVKDTIKDILKGLLLIFYWLIFIHIKACYIYYISK